MRDCNFCNYSGPSEIIYSTSEVFVIQPLVPIMPGHLLFVSKEHVKDASVDYRVTGVVVQAAAEYAQGQDVASSILVAGNTKDIAAVDHLFAHYLPRRWYDHLVLPWSGLYDRGEKMDVIEGDGV